jgi:hypothetical protein
MSRLAELQNRVLVDVENALREGDKVDAGVLGSFNAGAEAIIRQNRVATDAELLALHNLADHVVGLIHDVTDSEGGESVPSPDSPSETSSVAPPAPEAEGGAEPSVSVTQPEVAAAPPSEPAPLDELRGGELGLTEEAQPAPVTGEALFGGEEAHDEPAEADEDDGA